jgi:signal transduction histidine kinase
MPHLCRDLPEDNPRDGWPWWTPVLLAAVAASILGVSLLQGDGFTRHPQGARVAVAMVALAPWLLHIFVPLPRFSLEAVTLACVAWLGWHHSADAAWFVPIVAISQSVILWGTPTGVVFTAAIFGVLAWESATDPYGTTNWVGWYMGTLAGFAGGWGTRKQRGLVSELRSAQDKLARQSALGERQRIAREIHDVIAHSLTVTMLHLSAARLAVRSDPEEAEEALREAERVGRQSLADVRRTVDLLEGVRGGSEAVPAPLPGAADIAPLVEQFAAAGLDARLRVQGDPATVAPATGLGLYRIAQESLSNAVKHAPGSPVVVDLDINAGIVCLRVRNGLARGGPAAQNGSPTMASPGGFGLGGMAQRAALLGGRVEVGPDGDGWQVSVRVPVESASAEPPS